MWLLAAATLALGGAARAADCDDTCTADICPGDLTITEFMANPSYEPAYYGEWFEVHNATTANIDLQGLVVQSEDDPGFTVTTSLVVTAGGYLVFGVNGDTSTNGGIDVDYVYPYLAGNYVQMALAADSLSLVYDGALIDEVAWNNGTGWEVNRNYSHHVNDPVENLSWANDLRQNWCSSITLGGSGSTGGSWYGTPGIENTQLCTGTNSDEDGDGFSEFQGDCDDMDVDVNPDAIDGDSAPFGVAGDDADCDGEIDDGACDDDGDGFAEIDGDCDDDLNAVSPGQTEILDSVDNDCNGCVDDLDDDLDGTSDCDTGEVIDCDPDDDVDCTRFNFDPFSTGGPVLPEGYEEGDCAVGYDTNNGVFDIKPCAPETYYDGIDQGGDSFDACDKDGDGYDGDLCLDNPAPGFWEERPEDCDDNDPTVYPGGDEGDPEAGGVKDGKDNDCNGVVDDPFKDADADGYEVNEGDCLDDANDPDSALVYPGATETCGDLLDNDCNGMVDEMCTTPLGFTTVRGGGACTTAPGHPANVLALIGLLALATVGARRRGER